MKTLEGVDLTVKVRPTDKVEKLKAMLQKKKQCEDPIERKLLKVKVLADGLLVSDHRTLESAGLLHAESEVTIIYVRNVVEAATKDEIRAKGFVQVNIPSSLTKIRVGAFERCNKVVTVEVPETVTAIRDWAFGNCESLASITIPESVTAIGGSAFQECSSLASITIPNSVTAIGGSAFRGCSSLASVTLPAPVTAIEPYAFCGCSSLASITIPLSVSTAIGVPLQVASLWRALLSLTL